MILDVGCGDNPRGDVNVDLYRESPQVRERETVKTGVNVIADGCFLPFRDRVFSKVYSVASIEHSEKPLVFLRELIRVCCETVFIMCPHRFGKYAKTRAHKSYFNASFWERTLASLGFPPSCVKIRVTYKPLLPFVLLRPNLIYVKIRTGELRHG